MCLSEKGREMSSLGHCSRWLVVMLTFLDFIVGAVVAVLGLYFLLQQNDVSAIMGHVFMTFVAATLVTAGLLMILCALVGIIGALTLSRPFLLIFISLLSLICFLLLGGGIMALAFKSQINEEVRGAMFNSLNDYGGQGKTAVTHAWDRTQQELYCCAVDEQSWPEYRRTPWYRETPGDPGQNKPFVPKSCCLRNQYGEFYDLQKCQLTSENPPGVKNGAHNEALHYQGCFTAGKNHADEYFVYGAVIGFVVFIVMVISLIFSVMLLNQLRK